MDRTHHFVSDLVKQTPGLRPMYDAHLAANDELLPHVFMGDVTRYVIDCAMSGNDAAVKSVLEAAENGLTPGSGLETLIRSSFVENMAGEAEVISKLLRLSGPRLSDEIRRQFGQ